MEWRPYHDVDKVSCQPEDPGSGTIRAKPSQVLTDTFAQRYVLTFWGKPWPQFLAEYPGRLRVEQGQQRALYVLEGDIPGRSTSPTTGYKVWFDPEHNLVPIKWEICRKGSSNDQCKPLDSFEVQEFQSVGKTYFPARILRHVWNGGAEHVVIKAEINVGVPDSQFEISWTNGTAVWDDISKKGFIVGETNSQNPDTTTGVSNLIQHVPTASTNNTPARNPAVERDRSLRYVLFATMVSLALIIVALLARRLRRSKSK